MSLRQACMLFSISTSVYYYQAKRKDDSEVIDELSKLAELHRTWLLVEAPGRKKVWYSIPTGLYSMPAGHLRKR